MQSTASMYPSQYREYFRAWQSAYRNDPEFFNETGFKRLAALSRRAGGSYKKHGGVVYRVMFPFTVQPILPDHMQTVFDNAGYVVNLHSQTVVDKHKREVKIAKAYQQLCKINKVTSGLVSATLDVWSKVLAISGTFILVVSRHPYDVVGMSTGRNWTSCHTVGGMTPKLKKKFERDLRNQDAIEAAWQEHDRKVDAYKYPTKEEYVDIEQKMFDDLNKLLDASVEMLPALQNRVLKLVAESDELDDKQKGAGFTKVKRVFKEYGRDALAGVAVRKLRPLLRELPVSVPLMLFKARKFNEGFQVDLTHGWNKLHLAFYVSAEVDRTLAQLGIERLVPKLYIEEPSSNRQIVRHDYVETAGLGVSNVMEDVKSASVICYVIRPNDSIRATIDGSGSLVSGLVDKLETRLDKSNKDPLFDPLLRVILRLAGQRYYRVGVLYGNSAAGNLYKPQQVQFEKAAHKVALLLNKSRKRSIGLVTDSAQFDEDVDPTYDEASDLTPIATVKNRAYSPPPAVAREVREFDFKSLDRFLENFDDDGDGTEDGDDDEDYIPAPVAKSREVIVRDLREYIIGKITSGYQSQFREMNGTRAVKWYLLPDTLRQILRVVDATLTAHYTTANFSDKAQRVQIAEAAIAAALECIRALLARSRTFALSSDEVVNKLLLSEFLIRVQDVGTENYANTAFVKASSYPFIRAWSKMSYIANNPWFALNKVFPVDLDTMRKKLNALRIISKIVDILGKSMYNGSVQLAARSVLTVPRANRNFLGAYIPRGTSLVDDIAVRAYFARLSSEDYGSIVGRDLDVLDEYAAVIQGDIEAGVPKVAMQVLINLRK